MDDNSALFVSLNKPHSTVIVLNVMLTLWSVKNIYVVIINRPNRTLKTFSLTERQIPICR